MSSYGGANAKMSDVARTVAVLTLVVLAVFLLGRLLFTVDPDRPTSPVDYLTAAEPVQPTAGFEPLVPDRLPDDWYCNSARFDATGWEMGVVTDDEQFLGLRQVLDENREEYEKAVSADAVEVTTAEQRWRLSEDGGDLVYARNDDGVTTVLTTSTGRRASERYASSLAPLSEVKSSDDDGEADASR